MDARRIVGLVTAVVAVASGCTEEGDGALLGSDAAITDVYDPCDDDTECGYGCGCHEIELDYGYASVSDTMCTRECTRDEDCDYGGRCIEPAGRPALCHQRCMGSMDCYVGFECVDVHGDHDPVCAPL